MEPEVHPLPSSPLIQLRVATMPPAMMDSWAPALTLFIMPISCPQWGATGERERELGGKLTNNQNTVTLTVTDSDAYRGNKALAGVQNPDLPHISVGK